MTHKFIYFYRIQERYFNSSLWRMRVAFVPREVESGPASKTAAVVGVMISAEVSSGDMITLPSIGFKPMNFPVWMWILILLI